MSFNGGGSGSQQQAELDSTDNRISRSCGVILFTERKRQNLSIEQISEQINLSKTQIRALESDKYDILASASYIKGYIRLYANLLGMDVEDVLQYFKEPTPKQNASLSSIGRGIHKTRRTSDSNILKILLYLMLAAGLCVLFWFAIHSDNWSAGKGMSIESSKSQPRIEQSLPVDVASTDSTINSISVENVVESKTVPDTSGAGYGKQHLAMSFTGSAWVEVIDNHNQQVINKRYQSDEKLSVYAQPPLRIFISNVDAVNMQYNQADYDIAPHRQGAYAKFILNK